MWPQRLVWREKLKDTGWKGRMITAMSNRSAKCAVNCFLTVIIHNYVRVKAITFFWIDIDIWSTRDKRYAIVQNWSEFCNALWKHRPWCFGKSKIMQQATLSWVHYFYSSLITKALSDLKLTQNNSGIKCPACPFLPWLNPKR